MYVTVDFICFGRLELFATRRKRILQNEKFMPTAGFEPAMSRLLDWRSNVLRYFGSESRRANFISSGSKIVKRIRLCQYDPAIFGRTIGLLLPGTDHSSSVALWLTRRLGLYDEPCLNVFRGDRVLIQLFVGTSSAFGAELAYILCEYK